MKIIKRNGSEENLTKKKIFDSIVKANDCVPEDEKLTKKQIQRITDAVAEACEQFEEPVHIDLIEDMIEKKLMEHSAYEVAKRYISYRYEKERVRKNKNLAEKLFAKNVVNQNANVDEFSFGGRIGEAASYVMKEYALNHLISPMARANHMNNEIYIHDLSHYSVGDHNCVDRNVWIKIKSGGWPKVIRVGDFADYLGLDYNQICDLNKANYNILSREGWTKLRNITKRKLRENEKLYEFRTRTGIPLKVTEDHRLPVIRDGVEIVLSAKDIKIGDSLLDIEGVKLSVDDLRDGFLDLCEMNDDDVDIRIENIDAIRHYLGYKYGVDWVSYYKKNNFKYVRTSNTLTLQEFKHINSEYEFSFDLLSQLSMRSCGSKHLYPLHIPYSEALAKLYAYIYGDGGVYIRSDLKTYQLTFTNTNEAIMDDFIDCYESVFGYRLNKSYPTGWATSPCIRVTDGSKIACKIFKNFAGAKKYGSSDISMPDFVLNGSDNIKYAFLSAAIDTDGCLSNRMISYVTCGERYADQLMLLLHGLGYHPRKRKTASKGTKYRVGRKSGIRNYDIYSVLIDRIDEMASIQEHIDSVKHNDSYVYKGIENKFSESKITKILELEGDYDVFDVETASHWFIANNFVSHNCLSIPFDNLLRDGFNTRQTDIRPASSLNTAFQLVAVLFQIQSLQQFGGVAATHIDWTMVPYVRLSFHKHYFDGLKYVCNAKGQDKSPLTKDEIRKLSIDDNWYNKELAAYQYAMDKTIDELKQAVEGLYHNLNSLQSRSGSQLPFSSLNLGTCTLPEGRMVIKALLEGSINGVGKFHKTSIFPCGIFQCMKGVNREPGDPNYDLFKLALKSTAQRLYPNYVSVDWVTDKQNIQKDREIKNSVLNSLSDKDKQALIEWGEKHPDELKMLSLKISEE